MVLYFGVYKMNKLDRFFKCQIHGYQSFCLFLNLKQDFPLWFGGLKPDVVSLRLPV